VSEVYLLGFNSLLIVDAVVIVCRTLRGEPGVIPESIDCVIIILCYLVAQCLSLPSSITVSNLISLSCVHSARKQWSSSIIMRY